MFEQAKKIIEESNTIYIVAHVNPDGDAIGSTFAIYFALKKMGKDAHVVMPDHSTVFNFLPRIDEHVKTIDVDSYDLLIALDSSDNTRLAIPKEDYDKAKKIIMLDHHQVTNPYGDFIHIDDTRSSASEIAYIFLKYITDNNIDKDMATMLYTGIMTDTGCFNYNNTSARTMRVVAELLDIGAENFLVNKKINDTMQESKLRLVAKTVDNLESFYDNKLKYSYVSYEEIHALGISDEDAEGMTNYLRSIAGTEFAVYVRGKSDGSIKVSMRSGGRIDVSKVAIEFGGGGHPRAAGYTMQDPYEIGKEKLIKAIGEMI